MLLKIRDGIQRVSTFQHTKLGQFAVSPVASNDLWPTQRGQVAMAGPLRPEDPGLAVRAHSARAESPDMRVNVLNQ
jgi:hypothetical protein